MQCVQSSQPRVQVKQAVSCPAQPVQTAPFAHIRMHVAHTDMRQLLQCMHDCLPKAETEVTELATVKHAV